MLTKESDLALKDFISKDDLYISRSKKVTPSPLKAEALTDGGEEIRKYYTLNQTGNIMISSTAGDEKEISEDVKSIFMKVASFFAVWTAALEKKDRTLYDAEAITSIIERTGLFVRIHQEERTFDYTSAQGTLNTAIIGSILSGFSAMGSALEIAQAVVGRIGDEISVAVSRGENSRRIGHLLFICENLMGMPIVSVSLLNTTAKESETVSSSNCHSTVRKTLSMTYRQDSFLFVDPTYIDKFTEDFESNPDYEALIDKLADYLD